ncbi:asparagine synthase-related protein [Synechococcus sp. CCY 0621]|uniref:asparagine synthase-related protein n=1 Tax=Synechococcus sp. CCY 0621 TaxID=2815603 RepID=UPI001C22F428|nr:asparagine synthase-related protein [Synechococcus sp. CCY 0621]
MSGVFGLFNQDGKPVERSELGDMASLLERRGPDRTAFWSEGPVGLGLTLLTTTPELAFEPQPVRHGASGCVIVADVRLDNREELLAALGLADRAHLLGDAGLILEAYLAWGEACLDKFLGDFAFMLWDSRHQKLFGARDHFGLRPFYYHHSPGQFFAFASEPKAILVLPQAPYRLNEARIADFLVNQLEGIDKTCTFFEEVFRLPPAHCVSVTPERMFIRRYWTLEPGEELRLPSDEAYAEAFLEVFTEAVRCRLRSHGPVGSMLSGGMDSGSVVAVAKEILAEQGRAPLPTFSAVGPDPETCVETRAIHAALTMPGLDPTLVRYDQLDVLMPELGELGLSLDEPFDNHMTLVRAMYLAAHRKGLKVLLDGVAGDVVLSEGSHIARLVQRGHWRHAYREAVGQQTFWGGAYPAWRELVGAARYAFMPLPLRRLYRRLRDPGRQRHQLERTIREARIDPTFADRIGLAERLQRLQAHGSDPVVVTYPEERARAIDHPYLTVGRERYDRVAAAVAVEPRDPFLDQRVVTFCLSLPGAQKLAGGWPKIVLRRAMANRLPDSVRWRTGRAHLGWAFTRELIRRFTMDKDPRMTSGQMLLSRYLSTSVSARRSPFPHTDPDPLESSYDDMGLVWWLKSHRALAREIDPKPNLLIN